MATTTISNESTQVVITENIRVTYEKRSWFIFTWWVNLKTETLGKDLVINTLEDFDRIIVNGKSEYKLTPTDK